MSLGQIPLVLLMVSPLVYSGPGNLRFPAALVLASACAVLWLARGFRIRWVEFALVSLYGLTLIVQPYFVPGVWAKLVIGHALFMFAMFVPAWAIYSSSARLRGLEKAAARSMNVLFVITVISIYISYFFDIGEVIAASSDTRRAFAWLGDRFTPVIVLQIIFFSMQKSWLRVMALLAALLMTGGKSAMLLLMMSPLLYVLFVPMPLRKRAVIVFAVVVTALAAYFGWDSVLSKVFPGADWALNSRMLANQVGLKYFLDNPWFGVGIDQSIYRAADTMESIIENSGAQAYIMPRIHNAFLRTAAETGIFGLAALVGLCLLWTTRCVRIIVSAHKWPRSVEKSLVIAGALWSLGFIWIYQTVDWFMGGENQLAFLLMFSAVSEAIYRRVLRTRAVVAASSNVAQQSLPIGQQAYLHS